MWQREDSQGSEHSDASTALTLLASAASQTSSVEHLPSPSTASSLEPSVIIRPPEALFPSSSPPTPSSVPPEAPPVEPSFIAMKKWAKTLQENVSEKFRNEHGKGTEKQRFPKIWGMVNKIYKHWVENNWEGVKQAKNPTDVKRKAAKYILANRSLKLTSEILTDYLDEEYVSALDVEQTKVLYLCRTQFHLWAKNNLKDSLEKRKELSKSTPSDHVRLFGIAALQENRDDLLALGRARNGTRADADGPLNLRDSIFFQWAQQFNDESLVLKSPDRAVFLDSYNKIDANDVDRMKIKRDHNWIATLWKKVLSDYNAASKLWKMGTGGGSGAPENFSDWNERDGEIFADYGPWTGKRDDLAWINMLDKEIGFCFNNEHDPPPAESVLEDGRTDKRSPPDKISGNAAQKKEGTTTCVKS